jgi:rhodanese-related sulfurtransferase
LLLSLPLEVQTMLGSCLGIIFAATFCLGSAWLFHHYRIRLYEADLWLARGALLLDVDPPAEFDEHHPRGALGLPLEDLALRADEVGDKRRPVVVFAHSWLRAARGVHALRSLGFSKAMNGAGARAGRAADEADAKIMARTADRFSSRR